MTVAPPPRLLSSWSPGEESPISCAWTATSDSARPSPCSGRPCSMSSFVLVHGTTQTARGFDRLVRGLKPVAIGILVGSIAFTRMTALNWPTTAAVLGVDVTLLAIWLLVVTDAWVKEQAETYADRLFIEVAAAAPSAGQRSRRR